VLEAVDILCADKAECTIIGDSTSDIFAGLLADVAVIGYANKPGKADALTSAGAAVVTGDLNDITTALRITLR
jgi:beta-phosphoglucomutase-like phosphatase (HAD superfamily)